MELQLGAHTVVEGRIYARLAGVVGGDRDS